MAKETSHINSVESIVEEWLRHDLEQEPGKEFGVTLKRLKQQLIHRSIGILIDNLEPALDRDGKFILAQRKYIELLRILADNQVKSVTIITSRDRLCEADLNLEHYRLSGLDLSAWLKFFSLHQIKITPAIIAKMHQTYGGNAKAMGILCGVIRQDFHGDLEAYWQENSYDPLIEIDLKNLVANQFDRLLNLDAEAYLLLCRLGCYRYQDISTVPRSGLVALLWDIDKTRHRKIINSLRNRSLVEFAHGKYWLHPVIKAEALLRLHSLNSNLITNKIPHNKYRSPWQAVHLRIARFWTENIKTIDNIQDGLTALEAYYHYVEINDFNAAGDVILYSRNNQWGQFLTLGTTLYRLGLLQPLFTAIEQIIDKIEAARPRSELNNILGDLYWITGQIHFAIACQEKAITTVAKCLSSIMPNGRDQHLLYCLKMLQVDSLLSIGLYKIDLWELSAAANYFQQVIDLAQETKHHRWAEKASISLALVNSYLGLQQEAHSTANKFYQLIFEQKNNQYNTGSFAYFIQIIGQLYLNLGEFHKAQELFNSAIAFSQASHYTQIKAKSFTGIAVIYRQQNKFEQANQYHQDAIDLLEQIGAKCDLAEAYWQWGLTVKKECQIATSKKYFSQAIELFQQIEAPRQVEKVRSFINTNGERSNP